MLCLKLRLQLTKSVFGIFMFMTFHTLIDFDAHRMTRRKQSRKNEEKHSPQSKYAVHISCPLKGPLVFLWARPGIQSQFLCAHKNNLKYFKQNTGKWLNEIVWLSPPQTITKAFDQAKGNSAQLVWPKCQTHTDDGCVRVRVRMRMRMRESHQLAKPEGWF